MHELPPAPKKPWPMHWVVLCIVLGIGTYTWLTLKYRKTNPSYEPYADTRSRANTLRLLDAGYQRITLLAERPADVAALLRELPATARPTATVGGLPTPLASIVVEELNLAAALSDVRAPTQAQANEPWSLLVTCRVADDRHQLSGAQLYVKGEQLTVVPLFETLTGELQARTAETVVRLTVPAASLKPGDYQFTVVARDGSLVWPLRVR